MRSTLGSDIQDKCSSFVPLPSLSFSPHLSGSRLVSSTSIFKHIKDPSTAWSSYPGSKLPRLSLPLASFKPDINMYQCRSDPVVVSAFLTLRSRALLSLHNPCKSPIDSTGWNMPYRQYQSYPIAQRSSYISSKNKRRETERDAKLFVYDIAFPRSVSTCLDSLLKGLRAALARQPPSC